ncbi:MAG TPA: hypothetical protein VH539_15060 [Gemmatimonadaceae bacterium]|jgi:hypothetical protein
MPLRLLFIRHVESGAELFLRVVAPEFDVEAFAVERAEALAILRAQYVVREIEPDLTLTRDAS